MSQDNSAAGDSRKKRRIEPVPDVFQEPVESKPSRRTGLAVWLSIGPLLATIGIIGFSRLLIGVENGDSLDGGIKPLLHDLALLLIFVTSHTFFARGLGRKWLNKPFGPAAERPLHVMISGTTLCLLVLLWEPSGPMLWTSGNSTLLTISLVIVQLFGLVLVAASAFVVGAGGLAALPHLRSIESGRPAPKQQFVALPPYSLIRQPMNLGIVLMLWAMPEVSADRLLLMVVITLWIAFVAPIEERDAELSFGDGYTRYKERTPRWLPKISVNDS